MSKQHKLSLEYIQFTLENYQECNHGKKSIHGKEKKKESKHALCILPRLLLDVLLCQTRRFWVKKLKEHMKLFFLPQATLIFFSSLR